MADKRDGDKRKGTGTKIRGTRRTAKRRNVEKSKRPNGETAREVGAGNGGRIGPQQVGDYERQRDFDLYIQFQTAKQAGVEPTREQIAGAKRHQQREDERLRWIHYRTIPQKHVRAITGIQAKQLKEQAARYGLPFGDATFDMVAFLQAFFPWLASNSRKLLATNGEDPMSGEFSPALEKWRHEKWLLAKLERQERESRLLSRDQVQRGLGRLAGIIRAAGETLQRDFGPEAHAVLDEALEEFVAGITEWLGNDETTKSPKGGP